jgi:hypothetical protein
MKIIDVSMKLCSNESWEARVWVRVFSTLMPQLNENKSWWDLIGYYHAEDSHQNLRVHASRRNLQPSSITVYIKISIPYEQWTSVFIKFVIYFKICFIRDV